MSQTMRTAKLPEVAEIIMGQSPPGDTYNETGDGLPFFQGKAEFGETCPTVKKWCNAPKKIAEAGNILMSVRAPVGPTNLASERCCIGRGLAAIRANQAALDPGFLRFFLRHKEPRLADMGQGSTFAAIGRFEIASLELQLPSLDEQRRFVDILSRAEGIVHLRREAQKKAAELIPALFLDMFGDPATNPKGWCVALLRDIAQDVRNGFNPTKEQFCPGTRFVTVNALYNGLKIDIEELQTVSIDPKTIEKYRLIRGDICFVRSSVKRAGVGVPSVFDSNVEAIFGGFVIRVRTHKEIDPLFVCAQFHTPSMRRLVIESAGTGTITNVNQPALLRLPVIQPPYQLQQEFVRQAEQIESIQSQQETATQKAEATFDALLARIFGGL